MTIVEYVFWSSIVFAVYSYAGYPIMLAGLSLVRNKPIQKGHILPPVSLIITAYNEENRIREKLENSISLDYPEGRLEIVVASDCSTDRTDEIVRDYSGTGIRLIRAVDRKGKEAAQKLAVSDTSGEILVFSDTATMLTKNAIRNIVTSFNDPTVGCVSSVDRFLDADGRVSGEGAYVRYEMLLRTLETRVNSLVGLSGSFFAARRQVCSPWADDLQSDFNTLLNSMRNGLRGVSDPESIGYYKNLRDERYEYQRKVRTVLRGIAVLMRSLEMMNPFKYGLFAWQLFSHKLCRWLVPFAMILAFFSSAVLAIHSNAYLVVFLTQVVLYAFAFLYHFCRWIPDGNLFRLPSFFVLVNLSILDAWCRYIRGDRIYRWEPSRR